MGVHCELDQLLVPSNLEFLNFQKINLHIRLGCLEPFLRHCPTFKMLLELYLDMLTINVLEHLAGWLKHTLMFVVRPSPKFENNLYSSREGFSHLAFARHLLLLFRPSPNLARALARTNWALPSALAPFLASFHEARLLVLLCSHSPFVSSFIDQSPNWAFSLFFCLKSVLFTITSPCSWLRLCRPPPFYHVLSLGICLCYCSTCKKLNEK